MNVSGTSFIHPNLQVVLSGTASLPATWGRRNALSFPIDLAVQYFVLPGYFSVLGNDVEGAYLILPIHGRKRFSVFCHSPQNGVFDVRISVVSKLIESQVAPATGFPNKTTIAAKAVARFDVDLSGRAEWLIVYATRTAGGGIGADLLYLNVQGYDD